jgi:serine-type D-Ala-D-Ala carboxypeptidase (penicillin-binding protein 5/6)
MKRVAALLMWLLIVRVVSATDDLSDKLPPLIQSHEGDVAVSVRHLENGTEFQWRKDQVWPTASLMKLAVTVTAYRLADDHVGTPANETTAKTLVPLQLGANGRLVEMLQRTLNARMNPSPELSVDGDFGSATESAVRAFQESLGIPINGIAGAAMMEHLGPLIAEQPVPEPEVVNSERLAVAKADPIDGTPFVTCKAWMMVDANSGHTVGGHDTSRPLDIASTTKIMTAWLIVKYANNHPEILDEILTMSQRADDTRGSTSGIRVNEQLTIREALYGLLLPSGNDMSIGLAEHFGTRVTGRTDDESDPLVLFVEAMNTEATRLGMHHTTFRNPHGLTSPGHRSTCRDLAVLARTAFQNQLLRAYVSTRQRGATVTGQGGYRRNVKWKNTNRLLGIRGYDGIKTGTTTRAGACLVSTSERDGRRLILVVLGAASSSSRYTDTRNLYRWGWQQLR